MSWFWVAAAVVVVAGAAEAKSQRDAGKANAKIAENNARLDEAQAKDEANLSARKQQEAAFRQRDLIGKQRATIAANSLDPTQGSAFDLIGETALLGGAEQSALAMEGARRAWGFQQQALNRRNEGAQAKWQGKTQGNITLLRSFGQAAGYAGSALNSRKAGTT